MGTGWLQGSRAVLAWSVRAAVLERLPVARLRVRMPSVDSVDGTSLESLLGDVRR
jgi:hypothetical protein